MSSSRIHRVWECVIGWYLQLLMALQRGSRRLTTESTGQSMVEYAIVVALIAVVAMVAVQGLGSGIAHVFQNLLSKIQGIGG